MKYVYKKPSGKVNSINIPDDKIVGPKDDFVKSNTEWWAKAHGVSEAVIAEKLAAMWDIANPPKKAKPPRVDAEE